MPVGVVIGVCSAVLTAVVTEIYCHRCLAHHAFQVHPRLASVLDTYFRVIVMTDPETWAAIHRLHHRTRRHAARPALAPAAPTHLDPRRLRVPVRGGPAAGGVRHPVGEGNHRPPVLLVGFYLVMFGWVQVLVATVVHLVLYLGVMGMVNTVGHLYGRKPHPDVPGYDLAWLAIPLLGHGYHNSHHAHPAAARTGTLDPIWPVLRLLAGLRLVELADRRTPTTSPACCEASACLTAGSAR